ncbi:putative ferric-chelate reductase 1 [Oreochromis niloticus]|uniref:putative ferric-chelate reductase 1 n=1 Tax=Oreochromis niloticus TaxID=8128 RepID=UPI0009056B10|nr:putative ferric-chelate reductase 1 [Oreochromis niloticus]
MDLLVLLLLCTAPLIRGYRSGLVIDSCEDMKSHYSGLSAQTAPPPFTVTTEQRRYRLGEDVKVELQGPASTPFTGFLLEAIEVGSETPVGSFAIPAGAAKLLTCSQRPNSAVSHTSGFNSSYIQVTWRLEPSRDIKTVQFRASFVQNSTTFWVNVTSPVLTFTNGRAARSAGSLTGNGSTDPAPLVKSARSISSANCGVTKVCFSHPASCDPAVSSSCYFMSAMMSSNGTAVQYEMTGPYEGYIAFGFSDDQRMGNDDIYVCVTDSSGQAVVQHMYSTGRTTPQARPLGNVYNVTTSLQNNVISCSFTTTDIISIQGTSGFSQSYYFMFVHGRSSNGQIQKHSADFVSTTKMDISTPVVVSNSGFPDIIKAHGSLMLIAWMTTGSLGMMVARYLKKMAKGTRMCDKDLWFVVHVGVMCMTVAATIIAFILVFSHARDWSGGAHPVLGCLVMILSFFQPIVAMLRCGPQHHLRYLFNTSHFLNAVIIKSLAVAAIFTGLGLIDSSDGWLMKVMGGFLAWEALFYIMLEIHNGRNKHADSATVELESELVKIDGLLIGLFFLGNICFLVALLVGIGER